MVSIFENKNPQEFQAGFDELIALRRKTDNFSMYFIKADSIMFPNITIEVGAILDKHGFTIKE